MTKIFELDYRGDDDTRGWKYLSLQDSGPCLILITVDKDGDTEIMQVAHATAKEWLKKLQETLVGL